jgi:hydrogenase nickel incorporation protein HypB
LPYVDFDLNRAAGFARTANPELTVFPLSARTGEGMARWYDWLHAMRAAKRRA